MCSNFFLLLYLKKIDRSKVIVQLQLRAGTRSFRGKIFRSLETRPNDQELFNRSICRFLSGVQRGRREGEVRRRPRRLATKEGPGHRQRPRDQQRRSRESWNQVSIEFHESVILCENNSSWPREVFQLANKESPAGVFGH